MKKPKPLHKRTSKKSATRMSCNIGAENFVDALLLDFDLICVYPHLSAAPNWN
jgi:hypothetical protein